MHAPREALEFNCLLRTSRTHLVLLYAQFPRRIQPVEQPRKTHTAVRGVVSIPSARYEFDSNVPPPHQTNDLTIFLCRALSILPTRRQPQHTSACEHTISVLHSSAAERDLSVVLSLRWPPQISAHRQQRHHRCYQRPAFSCTHREFATFSTFCTCFVLAAAICSVLAAGCRLLRVAAFGLTTSNVFTCSRRPMRKSLHIYTTPINSIEYPPRVSCWYHG